MSGWSEVKDNQTKSKANAVVLLSAGGTGGHVFPACALATELQQGGYKVICVTDKRGLKYFDGLKDVELIVVNSGAYKPGLLGKLAVILSLLKGYVQSHKIMSQYKPSVAVGFGGYPSAPPLFAAQHRKIPTILHEQNAILGLANKLLAPKAKRLALSVSKTTGIEPAWAKKCVTTGNPVREEIVQISKSPFPDLLSKVSIMVVGGSQGAKSFSDIIPKALVSLPDDLKKKLHVYQQSRESDLKSVKHTYEGSGIETDIRQFFNDMAECLVKSHLLITRAGASTVAELTTAGRPAIYIPFPWNRDQQQLYNANQVVNEHAGVLIEEKDLTVAKLRAELLDLLSNHDLLEKMAQKAGSLGVPDASKRLFSVVVGEIH